MKVPRNFADQRQTSPLWGVTKQSLQDPNDLFEVILVLDGVDEAVSMNLQGR
jgi:hypothetical protein